MKDVKFQITKGKIYVSWFHYKQSFHQMSSAIGGQAKPHVCKTKMFTNKPEFVWKINFELKYKLFRWIFRVNDRWKPGWARLWWQSYWCQNCWSASLLSSAEKIWKPWCWSASEAKVKKWPEKLRKYAPTKGKKKRKRKRERKEIKERCPQDVPRMLLAEMLKSQKVAALLRTSSNAL